MGNVFTLAVLVTTPLFITAPRPVTAPHFAAGDVVKESETGVLFPVTFVAPAAAPATITVAEDGRSLSPAEPEAPPPEVHRLAGTGVREKWIFDVYAMGLYVDARAAWRELEAYRERSGPELATDDAFFDALLDAPVGMTMRLVMVRDVDADDMAEAFDESLAPRIRRRGVDVEAGLAALATFRATFRDEVVEGTELVFSRRPDGSLTTAIDGQVRGRIVSPPLARALFDVYLGRDPISGSARRAFGRGMAAVLAEGAEAEGRSSGREDGRADGEPARGEQTNGRR